MHVGREPKAYLIAKAKNKIWKLCQQKQRPKLVQSNSNIVESNIVENSNIVDDLAATKDFYLIKIQNSRNPK